MKLLIILLIIFTLNNDWKNDLKGYIEKRNIRGIVDILEKADKKERKNAVNILLSNKEHIPAGMFVNVMHPIIKDNDFMDIFVKEANRYIMDERIYPILINHHEKKGNKALIDFILKQKEGKLDYYKYAKIFKLKGILESIAKRSHAFSDLHFYSNGIMYAISGKKIYLSEIIKYNDESIKLLLSKDIYTGNYKEMLLMEMINRKRGILFTDEIVIMAVIDINNDYSKAFKDDLADIYRDMKQAIKHNSIMDYSYNENDEKNMKILKMASMLYTGNYSGYESFREHINILSDALMYTDILYSLFNSNIDVFKKQISRLLVSKYSFSAKMYYVKLLILTEYIDDGTIYRYYVLNDYKSMKPILMMIGKNSPLAYEMALKDNKVSNEMIDKLKEKDNTYAYILLTDYINNKFNKEQYMEFKKTFPDYPLIPLMEGMIK